jgi:nucleotide-binding universal stress UspA family protein
MALIALIPLDGTKLSEEVYALLPLVKRLGIDHIRLVSVWESAWEESESGHEKHKLNEVREMGRAYLEAYLQEQVEHVKARGFQVESVVEVGRPADEILESVNDVDLILIATHGRSGIARWWLGSVADEVIKESACPCLIIGPNVETDLSAYETRRIMVPLDGSAAGEQALALAAYIADKTGAELDIVRCMSLTAVTYDPDISMYSADLITSMEDSVKSYLQQASEKLGNRQITTTMLRGGAGEMLLQHERDNSVDLVVATTRGRTGVKRTALGSISDRLLHGSAPVLVFRPSDESPGDVVEAARAEVQLKI